MSEHDKPEQKPERRDAPPRNEQPRPPPAKQETDEDRLDAVLRECPL